MSIYWVGLGDNTTSEYMHMHHGMQLLECSCLHGCMSAPKILLLD